MLFFIGFSTYFLYYTNNFKNILNIFIEYLSTPKGLNMLRFRTRGGKVIDTSRRIKQHVVVRVMSVDRPRKGGNG